MASQDQSTFEALPSVKMETSPNKMKPPMANVTCFDLTDSSSSETTAVNSSLWNIPESGTFKNPYFIRPSEVKPETSSNSLFSNCNNLKQSDDITDGSNVIKEFADYHLITKEDEKLEVKYINTQTSNPNTFTKSKSTYQEKMSQLNKESAQETEQTKQPKDNNENVKNIKDERDIEEINESQEDLLDSEYEITEYIDDMQDDDQELLREIEELSKLNKAFAEKRRKKQCIRNECTNSAVDNPYWDKEFCSNDCVVGYCKAIFLKWIESAQKQSS